MFKRLGAAILLVEDLQKSIAFYRDTLELKMIQRADVYEAVYSAKITAYKPQ